jgi:hypothetical protein
MMIFVYIHARDDLEEYNIEIRTNTNDICTV